MARGPRRVRRARHRSVVKKWRARARAGKHKNGGKVLLGPAKPEERLEEVKVRGRTTKVWNKDLGGYHSALAAVVAQRYAVPRKNQERAVAAHVAPVTKPVRRAPVKSPTAAQVRRASREAERPNRSYRGW